MSMIVIAVVAIMILGGDLPDVARKFGGRYRDLRRSINDVQAQFRDIQRETESAFKIDDKPESKSKSFVEDESDDDDEPSAPKFKPPV